MSYITEHTCYKMNDIRYKAGVYIITNKINGKYYVGGAINLYDRFRLHIADLKRNKHFNSYLQRSINKHGIDSFLFEILQEYPVEIVFEMETLWITLLNATDKNTGYNRDKIAKTRKGAVLTEEIKDKISKSLCKNPDEWAKRLPQKLPYKTHYRLEPIIQLTLTGSFIKEWKSSGTAARELKIPGTNIVRVLKGKSRTCREFSFVYKSEYKQDINYSRKKGKTLKKVNKMDLDNKVIATYESCKQAAEAVQGFPSNINAICNKYTRNGCKTYKGFKWEFEQ